MSHQQQDFRSRVKLIKTIEQNLTQSLFPHRRHRQFPVTGGPSISSSSPLSSFPKRKFKNFNNNNNNKENPLPLIAILRHGERSDLHPEEEPLTTIIPDPGDPSLTKRGYEKARDEVAKTLIDNFKKRMKREKNPLKIRFIISPFLRCLQTAAAVLEYIYYISSNSALSSSSEENDEEDRKVEVTQLIIDNQWCELFNPQVVKNCVNEDNGPHLQENPHQVILDTVNNNSIISPPLSIQQKNSLPTFGESRETGYYRFRHHLREMLYGMMMTPTTTESDEKQVDVNTNDDDKTDLILIVTHGDALNAGMLELYGPKRIVYSCEYLAHYFIVPEVNNEFRGDDDVEDKEKGENKANNSITTGHHLRHPALGDDDQKGEYNSSQVFVPQPIATVSEKNDDGAVGTLNDDEEKSQVVIDLTSTTTPNHMWFIYQQQQKKTMNPVHFVIEEACGIEWFDEE